MGAARTIALLVVFALGWRPGVAWASDEHDPDEVIFTDDQGRQLYRRDLADVPVVQGASTVFFLTDVEIWIPAKARRLHDKGRKAGAAGSYDSALRHLERAISLAPNWAYPYFDLGYTHLVLEDREAAKKALQHVLVLQPEGFFHTEVYLDCIRREEAGILPDALCSSLVRLTDLPCDFTAPIWVGVLEKYDDYPPGWHQLAICARQADAEDAALSMILRGLQGDPDPVTRVGLLVNLALLMDAKGDHEEAVRILGTLFLDPESTPYGRMNVSVAFAAILD